MSGRRAARGATDWIRRAARGRARTPQCRARIAGLLAAGAAATALAGCGSVWTYGEALRLQARDATRYYAPPDSVAFALPDPPPVYAVVFKEEFWVPPAVPAPSGRPAPVRRDSLLAGTRPDTLAADTMTVPPVLLPPPPVQVDLTPAQENELIRTTRRDMARADSLLATVRASSRRGEAVTEQVEAARGLLRQAEAALGRKDYQGAANLARKSRILAENLASGAP